MAEPNDTILADNPTIFWGMEDAGPPTGTDDIEDLSGNGFDGSSVNLDASDFQQEMLNHLVQFGILFDRVNEKVEVSGAVAPGITDAGDSWSVFVVFRPNTNASRKTIFSVSNGVGSRSFIRAYENAGNGIIVRVANDAGAFWDTSILGSFVDQQPHTLFVAAGGGTITVKIDGGLVAETIDATINANGAVADMTDFVAGADRDSGGDSEYFGGEISRVAWFPGIKLANAKGLEYHKAALGPVATKILETQSANLKFAGPAWDVPLSLGTNDLGDFSGAQDHGDSVNLDAVDFRVTGPESSKLPHAISFNGIDESIDLPAAVIPVTSMDSPFSFGCWFKTSASVAQVLFAFWSSSSGNPRCQMLIESDGRLRFFLRGDNGPVDTVLFHSSTGWNDGQWHQAFMINEGRTSHKLVLDGGDEVVTDDSDEGVTSLTLDTARISLARNNAGQVDGSLAAFSIWDAALTDEEIAAIWDEAQADAPTPAEGGAFVSAFRNSFADAFRAGVS